MGQGGIAVSGGVTGKGTLISTNLLYYPLRYDAYGNPLAPPVYTLGGTAGAAGFEAAFAADGNPRTIWKTAASDDDIVFTMIHGATPPTVYGVVLIGHNLDAGPGPGPANYSLAKFEGGNDTNYNTVSEDLTVNLDALTPAYHLLTTPVAYDHWRIRVNFASSLALQIGEIFLIGTPPLAFVKNYQWGGNPRQELGREVNEGNGIRRVYTRWKRLVLNITFESITTAQKEALEAAEVNGHVICSPDGVNGKAYFGDLQLEGTTEHSGGWDVQARFIEAAR